jgi:hypothetical protein
MNTLPKVFRGFRSGRINYYVGAQSRRRHVQSQKQLVVVAQVTDNYVLWFRRKLNQGGRGYGLCLVGEVGLLEHVDDFSFALDLAVHVT